MYVDVMQREVVAFYNDDDEAEVPVGTVPDLELAVDRMAAVIWAFRFDGPLPERLRGLGLN